MIFGAVIVGAMIVGAMIVGAMIVGAMIVGAMIFGAMIVGAIRLSRWNRTATDYSAHSRVKWDISLDARYLRLGSINQVNKRLFCIHRRPMLISFDSPG